MRKPVIVDALAGMVLAAFGNWLFSRRKHQAAARHAQRLASEIAEVARSIRADLRRVANAGVRTYYGHRCDDSCREAVAILLRSGELETFGKDTLRETTLRLHEDHRRIVELRCELDGALLPAFREQQVSHA